MKKIFILLAVISFALVGCSQEPENQTSETTTGYGSSSNSTEPTITGEIVKIEDGKFLVESTTEKLPDGRPNAIWFTTKEIEPLKVGKIVSVWTDKIEESYPGQARATKIEIKE